jgi:2-polyprenyl-3-methyl-5-hydroxy-6-metoxy-1,4-benzoquinol methylase
MEEVELKASLIGAKDHSRLRRLKFIIDQAETLAAKRGHKLSILDCGCGIGEISSLLGKMGHKVTGIDIHQPSLQEAMARNIYPTVKFLHADAVTFDSSTPFDVIIVSELIEHIESPANLLTNIRRLLKEDGILILTLPNGCGLEEIAGRIYNYLEKKLPAWFMRQVWGHDTFRESAARKMAREFSPHVHFFSFCRLRKLFQGSHWKIVKWRNRGFLPSIPFIGKMPSAIEVFDLWLADWLPLFLGASWLIVAKAQFD